MKKFIFLVWVVCSSHLLVAQKQGIGLRLGDPLGITYKKYLPGKQAFELGLGSTSPEWNRAYYKNSFKAYSQYDPYRYSSHQVQSSLYLQGRYLFHYDIAVEGMAGHLEWYWGVGALLKVARVKYRFTDQEMAPPLRTDNKTDVDFGPEGIAGLEYTLEDLPLTIFAETSLMIELANRPGALRGLGALGVRYNFGLD